MGSIEHPLIAEVYDAIPSHRDRPDVGFYTALAAESAGSVLELGSGTGRILIPIARAGKKVSGLEPSVKMLARCRESLAGQPRTVRDNVELIQGKMACFGLHRQFGLVICPFNTFLQLLSVGEQLSCLQRVHQHLVTGGRFAFDVFEHDIKKMSGARFTQTGTPQRFQLDSGSTVELTHRNRAIDFTEQLIEGEIRLDITYNNGTRMQAAHAVRQRYLFRHEAEQLLNRCGFEVENLFGDFSGSHYGTDNPGLLVFVARKRRET